VCASVQMVQAAASTCERLDMYHILMCWVAAEEVMQYR
jgi:hypothetical protein